MTLKERFLAEETKLGHILKVWITGLLAILSILGGANEYLAMVPPDFIPQWLKISVVVSGVISFVAGKLTVKSNLNESNSKVLQQPPSSKS
jgi:hypothetical protein